MIQRWGKLPLMLLNGLDLKNHRYGFIGMEDWTMYPLLQPGSLVVIDETRRKVADTGWVNEFDRPIYFLEHRNGYACCWCNLTASHLVLQPHPASLCNAEIYRVSRRNRHHRPGDRSGYASGSGEATPYSFLSKSRIASRSAI